jgi:hypothetical protein
VFQSSRHFFDTATWYTYLQRPELAGMDERILGRYSTMYNAYFEEQTLIPPGQFHEVRFADLESDPVREIGRLYESLALKGWGDFQPRLETYVKSLSNYRKNDFAEISPELQDKVAAEWGRSFDRWGYSR